MSTQIAPYEGADLAPSLTAEEFEKRLNQFREFTKRNLREGVDWGRIPGTPTPTLYKPGAEKVMRWMGLVVDITILPTSKTDLAGGVLDVDLEGTVRHARTGAVLGTVHANANSEERKYKDARRLVWECRAWHGQGDDRKACGWTADEEPVGLHCPKCGAEKVKRPQALADQKNTLLKMGDKRIWVAAALLYTGASEAYTQDMEDMAGSTAEEDAPRGFCPVHKMAFRHVPAGTSKAGRAYNAFWACPTRGCKEKPQEAPEGEGDEASTGGEREQPAANPEAQERVTLLRTFEEQVKRVGVARMECLKQWASEANLGRVPKGPTDLNDTELTACVAWLQQQGGDA